jgi:uncharacterized membrane protein YfcA
MRWVAWLAVGYLFGGALGAIAASRVGAGPLRWAYVAYLAGLDVLLIARKNNGARLEAGPAPDLCSVSLLAVGLIAGFSSGFLGIGGGLATTVGLTAGLGVAQHQAQMVSLVLSLLPMTAPSAWVYWRQGWLSSWPILIAVILGLQAGTDLGAQIAARVSGPTLRSALIVLVSAMTAYMAYKAL